MQPTDPAAPHATGAGAPTPIDPPDLADLDRLLAPGLDGVAVEHAGRVHVLSPAQMMLRGLSPAQAARALLSEAAGSAAAALDLEARRRPVSEQGYRLLKFRVVHAAQSAPDAPPLLLHRGSRVIGQGECDSVAELRALSDVRYRIAAPRS